MFGRAFERLLDIDGARQLLSVDGENAIARAEIESGLREWSGVARIELPARIDFRQTVAIVADGVVGSQQPAGHAASAGNCASATPQMPDREFPQHLLKNVVEVGSGCDRRDIRLVTAFVGRRGS